MSIIKSIQHCAVVYDDGIVEVPQKRFGSKSFPPPMVEAQDTPCVQG